MRNYAAVGEILVAFIGLRGHCSVVIGLITNEIMFPHGSSRETALASSERACWSAEGSEDMRA